MKTLQDALDFIKELEYIIDSEHSWKENNCHSTSRQTYIDMENVRYQNICKLNELKEFIESACSS